MMVPQLFRGTGERHEPARAGRGADVRGLCGLRHAGQWARGGRFLQRGDGTGLCRGGRVYCYRTQETMNREDRSMTPMMPTKARRSLLCALLAIVGLEMPPARADAVGEFYKGK